MSFIKPDTRFFGQTDKPHIMPVAMHEYGLMKQASGDMHPDIDAYIKKARPINGKNILLIDALGAGEVWGANVNGDWFPREELTRGDTNAGFKSFEHHAYPYKHHQNESRTKDERRRYGDKVVMSRYFEPMDRVQLIVIVDSSPGRADDIVTQCDRGMYPDVSMACGVAYDQCSICGKIHRTRADYCQHCNGELNKIYPDGQKVFLYNFRPRFHDISFVFVGADRSAKVLQKVASAGYAVQDAIRGGYDLNYLTEMYKEAMAPKVASQPKRATIEKEITLTTDDDDLKIKKVAKYAGKALDKTQKFAMGDPAINTRTLDILSKFAMGDVVSTLNQLAIPLRPQEFQYLMLSAGGNQKRAMEMHIKGQCFDPDSAKIEHVDFPNGNFSHEIAKIASTVAPDRSGHYPFIMARMRERDLGKRAAVPSFKPASFIWPLMGGLFMGYKKKLPADLQKMISKGAKQISPYVTPVAAGTALHMAVSMGRSLTQPGNGYESNYAQDNFMDYDMLSDSMDENSGYDDFTIDETSILDKISGIPALAYGVGSVPLIYMYSNFARNKANQTPGAWENMGPVNRFVSKHPDASALLGLLAAPTVVKTLKADTSLFKKLGS